MAKEKEQKVLSELDEGPTSCPDFAHSSISSLFGVADDREIDAMFALLSAQFDQRYYVASNPDVYDVDIDPLAHFILYGCSENRSPNGSFDPIYYSERYLKGLEFADVPFLHYLRTGKGLGYFPNLMAEKIDATECVEAALEKFGTFGFLEIFDCAYYNACHLNVSSDVLIEKTILHFLETGFDKNLNFSESWGFDPRFYISQYANEVGFDISIGGRVNIWLNFHEKDLDLAQHNLAYSHFLMKGYGAGYSPNLSCFIQSEYGIKFESYEVDVLKDVLISKLAIGGDFLPRDYLNQVFLSEDMSFILDIEEVTPDLFKLLLTIGNHHASDGRDKVAELIYGFLRPNLRPGSRLNLLHADVSQRLGCEGAALAMRLAAKREGVSSEWLYLHLHYQYDRAGAIGQSSRNILEGEEMFPGDFSIREVRSKAGESLFSKVWMSSKRYAKLFGLKSAHERLDRVLGEFYKSQESGKPNRKIQSIAIVANMDLPQCKLYRVDQKVEAIKHAGFSVQVFSQTNEVADFVDGLDGFDAVIFYRVAAFPHICNAIRLARISGLRTFYEIDDQIFDRSVFPPSFESYADQISFDDYLGLGVGVPLFEKAMSLCEYGIASTPTIRNAMSKVVDSEKVFLHRNALGSIHEYAVDTKKFAERGGADVIEIFYGSGTKAHKEVIYEIIGPVFKKLKEEYGDRVRFKIIGYIDRKNEHFSKLGDSLNVIEPMWDIEEYWDHLSKCDVNLAILESSELTDGKSEIKWMEAAMFGIPSIVSPTKTYKEVLTGGEDVLFAGTKSAFAKQLKKLIDDPVLRGKIGSSAKKLARQNYSLQPQADNITAIMRACDDDLKLGKKKILIVNVFYAPQSVGGATRVVEDNVRELLARYSAEIEIEVVCTMIGSSEPYKVFTDIREGVRVHAIAAPTYHNIDSCARDPLMGDIFEKILESVDPQVVHFHCIQRLTASIVDVTRRKRIPYVISMHDGWWFSPNQFLIDADDRVRLYDYSAETENLDPRARELRKALLGAEKLLPVSHSFGQIMESTGLENIQPIENGVSNITSAPRKERNLGKIRLAHIGGNSRHKGVHLVKLALLSHDFKNLHLTLIDHSFSPTDEVSTFWGSTPVTIRGKYPFGQVSELYSNTDILLAPSIWPESYGLVTREALMSGCWVVTSNVGAIGDCVDDKKNGFIVDIKDHLDLRRVLKIIDKAPQKFRDSPKVKARLRKSDDQAVDLMDMYRRIS